MVLHPLHIGVDVQRAEAARERLVLVRLEAFLAPHHDDLVVQKRLMDAVKLRIRQAGLKVQPEDFSAQRAGQGEDVYAHPPSEPSGRQRRKAGVSLEFLLRQGRGWPPCLSGICRGTRDRPLRR